MRRKLLTILFIALSAPIWALDLLCGTWIELRANPVEGWHFERWSDGNTDSVRQIEVTSSFTLYAHFAQNCEQYTLPVVSLYDWLLMLDMQTIQQAGYFFNPQDVTWYRVRGVADEPGDETNGDDEAIAKGYYLTLNQSMVGTGDYYAVADVSATPSGKRCSDYLRSELVHYAASAASSAPMLEPTIVQPNEPQRLLRLNPNKPTTVTVYDISGHRLQSFSTEGVDRLNLQAAPVAGCYQVLVQNGEQQTMLRYIVIN